MAVFTASWKYKLDRRQAYSLFHQGAQALAKASYAGICVDVGYCKEQQAQARQQAKDLEEEKIWATDVGRIWRAKYGRQASIESTPQVAHMLFNVLGCTPVKRTRSEESYSVDKDSLGQVEHPLAEAILNVRKLRKIADTFLAQILREVVDGMVHPNFNLHNIITYRSSSSAINFQNQPIRDPVMGKIVRGAFRPRPGRCLVEIDFKQLEVSISCCYHMDPSMVRYLSGEGDMHLDAACDNYVLTPAQVGKMVRYAAKNRFVFPEFYGSYFEHVAPALWKSIRELKLTVEGTGQPLMEHLAKALHFPTSAGEARQRLASVEFPKDWAGGSLYGDPPIAQDDAAFLVFREHVKEVERRFWYERFPVYRQWKEDWFLEYQRTGVVPMLTGFQCVAPDLARNDVINYPVQGSAFHCLLKTFVSLDEMIESTGLDAILVGQIHDSVIADVAVGAVRTFLERAAHIASVQLPAAWRWISVPVKIEAEVCPPDGAWHTKRPVELPNFMAA